MIIMMILLNNAITDESELMLLTDANKNVTVRPFGVQTIKQHDQLVINKSDRSE